MALDDPYNIRPGVTNQPPATGVKKTGTGSTPQRPGLSKISAPQQNALAPDMGQIRQGTPLAKTTAAPSFLGGVTAGANIGTGTTNAVPTQPLTSTPPVSDDSLPPGAYRLPDGRIAMPGNMSATYQVHAPEQSAPPPQVEVSIPPVESAEDQLAKQMQLRMEQDNLRNMQKTRRDTHDRAVRAGYVPGSAQYEQMMRNAETDASNQNIAATNKFREFATQREGEVSDRNLREFETFNKYIESDVGQRMSALVAAQGGDWRSAMASLYEIDPVSGKQVLSDKNKDKTKDELMNMAIASGAKSVVPDNYIRKPGEEGKTIEQLRAEWTQRMTRMTVEQGFGGLEETDKFQTAGDESDTRIASFVESGDFESMAEQDWEKISDTDLKTIKDNYATDLNDFDTEGVFGSGGDDGHKSVDALAAYKKANPWSEPGLLVMRDGKLYITTKIDTHSDGKTALGYQQKRATTWAKPVGGGPEIRFHSSNKYMPK